MIKKRLKDFCSIRSKLISDKSNISEITYVDIGSVKYPYGIINKETLQFSEAPSRARKRVFNQDIIISTVRTYLKSLAQIENPEKNLIVSTGFAVLRPKNNSRFLYYQLQAEHIQSQIFNKSMGVAYPSIKPSDLLSIKTEYIEISQESKTAIANYLDHNTSKIDSEVDYLEKKATILDEFKQSLIFETVTKGLDKSIQMKDSGIEWLGEIPEHWEVKRIKNLISLKGGGADKKIIASEKTVSLVNFVDVYKGKVLDNKLEYMKVSCPEHKISQINLRKNDLLITPSSETRDDIGVANIVVEDLNNTVFSYHILRMRLKDKTNSANYLKYLLNSKQQRFQYSEKATGTTRVTLSRDDILTNYLYLPTKSEQKQIADHLDKECGIIDTKVNYYRKKAKLLKEYKQSLIYEAVTGKIEIPKEFF